MSIYNWLSGGHKRRLCSSPQPLTSCRICPSTSRLLHIFVLTVHSRHTLVFPFCPRLRLPLTSALARVVNIFWIIATLELFPLSTITVVSFISCCLFFRLYVKQWRMRHIGCTKIQKAMKFGIVNGARLHKNYLAQLNVRFLNLVGSVLWASKLEQLLVLAFTTWLCISWCFLLLLTADSYRLSEL